MARKFFKYLLITLSCIIVILVITNPSIKTFKEFSGNTDTMITRESNFLIFSIFAEKEYATDEKYGSKKYFLGIALNFFKVREETVYDK